MNLWIDCERKPLTELLEFIVDNRGRSVPTAEKGHILIATNCIKNDFLYPKYEKIRYLSQETYESFFRAHPLPGDIIFVNKGTPGRVCLVPDPVDFCIAQDMIALRADRNLVDNHYLLAVLRTPTIQTQIHNTYVGDVIPHFKKQFMDRLLIPLPSMNIQKKIGDIYYTLCDKIEVNRRINAELEELTQALFKSWFVDFEPFKDGEFVESELGMIPKGWKVGNLLDVATLYDSMRKPLSGRERDAMEKIYPYYGATSIMDYVDKYIFDGIYLLMGEDGSVVDDKGFPILQYVWGKFWPNNHAHVMQGKNGFTTEMLHSLLSITNVKSVVTGAVQAKISQMGMKNINIVIAPNESLEDFSIIISPIYDKIRANSEEILHLTALRDTLLPKLMSGEIDLNEVKI